MQPNDTQDPRPVHIPPRDQNQPLQTPARDTAVRLMREQIDTIYDDPAATTIHDVETVTASTSDENPYEKSHSETGDHAAATEDISNQWQQYHSQWQNYYQQYYERYYVGEVQRQKLLADAARTEPVVQQASAQEITKDQAVSELRSELLGKIKNQGEKVRRSRHFMPAIVAACVAGIFLFLQYNTLFFGQLMAYAVPSSNNSPNAVVDPTASAVVSPEPKIIIPKINVNAPVVYDVSSLDEHVVQTKLKDGVVHYPIPGADGFPGQKGNTVILGHSSNDVFDDGKYKFVFVQLDSLAVGDMFYLNYNSVRYAYKVTEKKIIEPNQVSELVLDNSRARATLVTCTPPGTALKRLVVIGEQISPNPDAATEKATTPTSTNQTTSIGGAPKSFFERLFNF